MAHRSSAELLVMHGLRVKGMADAAAVAQRFALDRELVDELLLDYEASDGSRMCTLPMSTDGHRLRRAGRGRTTSSAELDQTGARPQVVAAQRCSSHSTHV